MRNKYFTISLATVLGAIMLIMLFASAVTALNVRADEPAAQATDTVTVSGSHTIYVSPDKAEIHFGINTTDSTADKAQEKNTKEVDAVIAALKELGVKEKSIVTSSYNIYQEYDYENDKPSGYTASMTLTVKDIENDDIGKLLSGAVKAGATQVQYISYSCSNYDEEYENALKEAVAAAKKKAEVLAEAAGKEIGSVQAILEGYQDTSAKYINKDLGVATEESAAAYDSNVTIMPEDSEIVANVTVSWYLK